MTVLLTVLAVLGIAAVAVALGRALLRLLGESVRAHFTGQAAETHARRGDLTGLSEASEIVRRARRARMRTMLEIAGWTALLVIPPLTPWARWLYACYAILWLIPGHTRRRSA